MKTYNIYPNFRFQVEANNEEEAREEAYDTLKEMTEIKYFEFNFDVEKEE